MNHIKNLPAQRELLTKFPNPFNDKALLVNAHFHTPYSFSAFHSIQEIFEQAVAENIDVLGINDFITTNGYDEFNTLAFAYKKFPLFNVEFMGLMKEEQEKGIRINDPSNPGRIYFCGKGLSHPVSLTKENHTRLNEVFEYSLKQVEQMTRLVNQWLNNLDAPFDLDFNEILGKYSKGLVRERHIAMALRIKINSHFKTTEEKQAFLVKLYGGSPSKVDLSNTAQLDNELRSRLLKAGGKAFVPEDNHSFLSLPEMIEIILDAKGIPFYPVLLDDEKGNKTEFESVTDQLALELSKRRVFAVELIPGRNNFKELKDFVNGITERGFIVTFGTEHNTSENVPLEVTCRGGIHLDEDLITTGYQGACIIAAHQYLVAKGEEGYLTSAGFPRIEKQDNFIALGNAIIRTFIEV